MRWWWPTQLCSSRWVCTIWYPTRAGGIKVSCKLFLIIIIVTAFAGQYFEKHLPLANGIVTAGSGIGTLAMGPFYDLVLSNLGWKKMLRILSGFAFVMFLSALMYRPLPAKYKRAHIEAERKTKIFDLSVWKMKSFVFWVVSMSLLFMGYFVPFIHLVRKFIKSINQFLTNRLKPNIET